LREIIIEGETSYATGPPPIFDGEEYELWDARMTTHLDALDLREALKETMMFLNYLQIQRWLK